MYIPSGVKCRASPQREGTSCRALLRGKMSKYRIMAKALCLAARLKEGSDFSSS